MAWLVIAALAAVYLLVRFVQIIHFIISRFALNPAIPLPIKVAALVAVVLVIWGIRRSWKWYLRRPGHTSW